MGFKVGSQWIEELTLTDSSMATIESCYWGNIASGNLKVALKSLQCVSYKLALALNKLSGWKLVV